MDLSKIAVILNPYVQSYTAELRGARGRYVTAITKAKKLFLRIPRYKKPFVLEFPSSVKRANDRKRMIRDFMQQVMNDIETKRRKRRDSQDRKKGIKRKKARSKYPIKVASTPTTEIPGRGDVIIDTEEDYQAFEVEDMEIYDSTVKVKPFKLSNPKVKESEYKTFYGLQIGPYVAVAESRKLTEEAKFDTYKAKEAEINFLRFDATVQKLLQDSFKKYGAGYYQVMVGLNMKIRDGKNVVSQEGASASRIFIDSYEQIKDLTNFMQLKNLRKNLASYLSRSMTGKMQINSIDMEFVGEQEVIPAPEEDL